MTTHDFLDVLEATGYIDNGDPAHGVFLGEDVVDIAQPKKFVPDALWRGDSRLTVYFKHEHTTPSDATVAEWRREIWNKGFAPLLWVISPDQVEIYNGFGRPNNESDAVDHRLGIFKTIEEELNKLDAFAGRLAMETGNFWQWESKVNRHSSVDRQLLSDINLLERNLKKADLDRTSAQALIGCSIFTQYLIDREIVTREFLKQLFGHTTLAGVLRDSHKAKKLFEWLRNTFNGDIFQSNTISLFEIQHLHRIADFLDAVDPETGQTTFFPYQFDVIPVELISSIYEQFARSSPSSNESDSEVDVFYTRLSLVSLIMDEVTDGLSGYETVLDLSCGSGVFLVEALRRLVALRSDSNIPSRETIRNTLYQQICGFDISESAVQVAAFSLYLAALELDPDPSPPESLKFEPLIGKTLFVLDAWSSDDELMEENALVDNGELKKFDLIVGNPPWSFPGREARAAQNVRYDSEAPRSPRGVSLNFVSQAMKFASSTTRVGIVLSAAQFFSRSMPGRNILRRIINDLSPVTLVNLSFQSDWLFSKSKYPAMILLARHRSVDPNEITTVQVPWSRTGALTHTFEISRDDINTLPRSVWQENPEFLKAAFYGFRSDLKLLKKLISKHENLANQLAELDTKICAGLKLGNKSNDSRLLHGLPLLKKGDLRPFWVPNNLRLFNLHGAERPRNRENYRAPLLLIREFFKSSGRLTTAVAKRDIVYTDAYFGASFPIGSWGVAGMLAAILSSSLASWFFLMTGSAFGLSLPRVLLRDIEQIPIPVLEPALNSKSGRKLVHFAIEPHLIQQRDYDVWPMLDTTVYDLYELDNEERIVVKEGLYRAKWQHWKAPKVESATPVKGQHIQNYAELFIANLDIWFAATKRHHMRAEIYELPDNASLRVVRFILIEGHGNSTVEFMPTGGNLRAVLNQIGERLNVQLGASLVGQRGIRVYGTNEIVIIKPAARRHWMGVSAIEDADKVVADSMFG